MLENMLFTKRIRVNEILSAVFARKLERLEIMPAEFFVSLTPPTALFVSLSIYVPNTQRYVNGLGTIIATMR